MLLVEERTHALLASATQDQGLTHLLDTIQHAEQAELLLKEKVRMERYGQVLSILVNILEIYLVRQSF